MNKDNKNEVDFIDEPVDPALNLSLEIEKLKREKNAVILAHYYVPAEVQDVADFVGDSLALSQAAAATDAETILFAGVHFMGETAKILSPQKTVLIPDRNAGCSLADSCKPADFKRFIEENPGHTVISYVNTSAAIKALTDIVCTSTNAVKIVQSVPENQPVIFAPDRNLGSYIQQITGRDNMVVWDGACHVHEAFSLEKMLELKQAHPAAKILVHPECPRPIRLAADYIGSTAGILDFAKTDSSDTCIVVTEPGILHEMRRSIPHKTLLAAPAIHSGCGCNDCAFMKLVTLKKVYLTLKHSAPEITIDEELRRKAEGSIRRMLALS